MNPPAQVIDTHRAPGQRLVDFEVLGSVPGVAPRCYAVRLVLDEPAEEIRARYIVVGINPLWVFRHEDYDMLAHWDHVMPNEEQQHTAAGGKGGSPEGGIP